MTAEHGQNRLLCVIDKLLFLHRFLVAVDVDAVRLQPVFLIEKVHDRAGAVRQQIVALCPLRDPTEIRENIQRLNGRVSLAFELALGNGDGKRIALDAHVHDHVKGNILAAALIARKRRILRIVLVSVARFFQRLVQPVLK